MIALDLA